MNWLRGVFCVLLIVAGILLIAFGGINPVLGTVILIALVYFIMTAGDAGYNSLASEIKRTTLKKEIDLNKLCKALNDADLDLPGPARMGHITGVPGEAIIFEHASCPNYYYVYLNSSKKKLFVASNSMKSFVSGASEDIEYTDVDIETASDEVPGKVLLLHYACRNYIEDGFVSAEPTESNIKEENEEPPKIISAPVGFIKRSKEKLEKKGIIGLFYMAIGFVLGIVFLVSLMLDVAAYDSGLFSAILLFFVAPASFLIFWYGVIKLIIGIVKKTSGKKN